MDKINIIRIKEVGQIDTDKRDVNGQKKRHRQTHGHGEDRAKDETLAWSTFQAVSSCGQMSEFPEKGETVMVWPSRTGRLSLYPPSV
jgi:hypothetical protein